MKIKSLNYAYLSRVDQLRFLAALLVIFHHFRGFHIDVSIPNNIFTSFINVILIKGSSGVSLFLVLSAFLFTLITQGGECNLL